ncbi:MAG: NFACT family protein [Nanoarchaeota archaeon]|nr:NFACT family protein [Nanoarchaeota archaeon]
MKILSSLEIKAIVSELQDLVDGKVDNIYQPDSTEIVIAIHKTDIGKKFIRIVPGVALYITKKKRLSPDQPMNFCRFLKNRLKSARIKEIKQKELERVIEIHFESIEEKFIMICEFFSKGNIILCNEEYTIISALQVQLWKDRKIKAKEIYRYPPVKPMYFDDYEDFALFLEKSIKKDIVRKLSDLNLGGLYAEEICVRAKVDKNSTKIGDREVKKLYTAFKSLLTEEYEPYIVRDNPVPFRMDSLGEGESFLTYSEALEEYYSQFIEDIEEEEEKDRLSKVDKHKLILEEQQKQFENFEELIVINKIKGDWIYANYVKLQELMKLYKENKHDELRSKGVIVDGTNIIVEIE